MTERTAVEIVATLDTADPDYQTAVSTALAQRGTRDAGMVLISRGNTWDNVLTSFPGLTSDDPAAAANIDVPIAIAHWINGDGATACRILAKHDRHHLARLTIRCISRASPRVGG